VRGRQADGGFRGVPGEVHRERHVNVQPHLTGRLPSNGSCAPADDLRSALGRLVHGGEGRPRGIGRGSRSFLQGREPSATILGQNGSPWLLAAYRTPSYTPWACRSRTPPSPSPRTPAAPIVGAVCLLPPQAPGAERRRGKLSERQRAFVGVDVWPINTPGWRSPARLYLDDPLEGVGLSAEVSAALQEFVAIPRRVTRSGSSFWREWQREWQQAGSRH
jgi:hypothetical protein